MEQQQLNSSGTCWPGSWESRAEKPKKSQALSAAGGGDADDEAEADGDDEAESDDDRERIARLEAIEHGEVDWDDNDAYSLGRGQSWSSVDHLA